VAGKRQNAWSVQKAVADGFATHVVTAKTQISLPRRRCVLQRQVEHAECAWRVRQWDIHRVMCRHTHALVVETKAISNFHEMH
jgi:hypothetical protein